jgi:hypothetical protein
MRPRALPSALVLVCVISAACTGGKTTPTPRLTTPPPARIASTAKLAIISPTQGAVVKGTSVTVKVSLKDAKIVQPTTTHIVPDEGHLHILVDGQLMTMTAALSTVVPGLKPGHHVLEAEFVANDHAPFDPPVVAVVSIDVQG